MATPLPAAVVARKSKPSEPEPEKPPVFVVAGRFRLVRKIGSGGFGEVFLATDFYDHCKDVAVKLEHYKLPKSQLYYESLLYKEIQHGVGIPQIKYFGKSYDYNALAMEKLGPSLADLFSFCPENFSLKTVLMLADQMINRVWFLHRNGIIHRDIKPENFLMGMGPNCATVYVIDLGLAIKYMDSRYRKHIPYATDRKPTGTISFISANVHKGIQPARRDDLESLGNIFVYLLRGHLPWLVAKGTKLERCQEMLKIKMATSVEELCKDCPEEFLTYLNYCRNLGYEETPDYEYLLNLLRGLFWTLGVEYDNIYDWMTFKPRLPYKQSELDLE